MSELKQRGKQPPPQQSKKKKQGEGSNGSKQEDGKVKGSSAVPMVALGLLVIVGAIAFLALSPPSTPSSSPPPTPQQQEQRAQEEGHGAKREEKEDAASFVQRMKVATAKKTAAEAEQPGTQQQQQQPRDDAKPELKMRTKETKMAASGKPGVPFANHPQMEFMIEGANDQPVPGALSKIIAPLSLVNLFYTYADEHPFHLRRISSYYDGLNSNLSHIDLMLRVHAGIANDEVFLSPQSNRTQANCAFVKHGMDSLNEEYNDAYHAYLDGCTIVCNLVPSYWQPLAGLMDGILKETGLAYMANMYLTPRRNQGFVEHTDNKDGLIVQTAGKKQWTLKDTTFPMPLRHQMAGRPWERPVSTMAADVAMEPVLTAGDVLFIPRGMPHYAHSFGDYPSLHFTVSPTKNLEWAGLYRDLLDVGRPFIAARLDTILGGDTPDTQEMLDCTKALADQNADAIAAATEQPGNYDLRRSLPWWYRALAGVTVPSVHSAIGHTANTCRERLEQQPEPDLARVAQAKALSDKLAKGVTMPKVFELLSLCRPAAPSVPISNVKECSKVTRGLKKKGARFLQHVVDDIMEDQELLKTILPTVMKRNSLFIDYTTKLQQKGLEQDPEAYRPTALQGDTAIAFSSVPWSFHADETAGVVTINTGADEDKKQQTRFRYTPQLAQLLARTQELQKLEGSQFQLRQLATATEPRDDFEATCLVRVLAAKGVLRPAPAARGDDGVPDEYQHLVAEAQAPPPVPVQDTANPEQSDAKDQQTQPQQPSEGTQGKAEEA